MNTRYHGSFWVNLYVNSTSMDVNYCGSICSQDAFDMSLIGLNDGQNCFCLTFLEQGMKVALIKVITLNVIRFVLVHLNVVDAMSLQCMMQDRKVFLDALITLHRKCHLTGMMEWQENESPLIHVTVSAVTDLTITRL
ncbi:hypothetical protein HOLleu_14949 [Holothuria leucospilota]|uniref:Uncharacterized protein n=1 Tax=Holothuria leucospilota TaxID=206669 RepID=A0A9Q1C9Q3_HOLLE|nr:hypothetical protein HOLleu_14949 [Holothuria leucospilota]